MKLPKKFEFKVVFNPKLRSSAGRANRLNNTVEINPHMLRANPTSFADTLIHEICHLLTRDRHGKDWQGAMMLFGFPPQRFHLMEAPVRKEARYKMFCNCREHLISQRRFNKFKRGFFYTCRDCGAKLREERIR